MKPLEALKRLKDLEDLQGGRDEFFEYVKIIEKALKKQDKINTENAVLKYWLMEVQYYIKDTTATKGYVWLDLIKKIKALEIIKEKVNPQLVDFYGEKRLEIIRDYEGVVVYLTEEEFDLLMEVLK